MRMKIRKVLKKKWNVAVYFIFLILTFFFMWLADQSGEQYQFKEYDQTPFAQPWSYEFSDGVSGETALPARLSYQGDADTLTLTNTLPDVWDGMVFIYRSRHSDVKIYIGGELVYDSMKSQEGEVKKGLFPLAGNIWNEVSLREEYSGQKIVIKSTCALRRYLRGPGDVYLGDRATFFLQLVESKASTIVGSGVLAILATILFVAWVILTVTTRKKYSEILCLALFTASMSLWGFTESRCLQFGMQNMRGHSVFAFEILPLIPVPIALYFTYGKRHQTVRLARVAAVIPLVIWALNNLAHFLGILDLAATLPLTQVMLIFEVLFIGVIQGHDLLLDRNSNGADSGGIFWRVPLVGLVIMVPFVLWDLRKYLLADLYFTDKADATCFGIIAYIIALACHSALRLASENFKIAAASEAKTQFLANMSHEIRTPLNAVLGFDELILRDAKDKKILDYAVSIQNAGVSLRDTINSILDFSKIESGRIEITSAPYHTVQLIDNVSSIASALAAKKNLYFRIEIDENLPAHMDGDEVHIRQVLVNLLTNAVKYTYEGGVIFRVQLADGPDEEGNCMVRYAVKDTGLGIKQEDRERLFEKFERLDPDVNRNTEGTGLGMSIVAKLLEAMGSKVELESVYHAGSEFYFYLTQKALGTEKVGIYEEAKTKADAQIPQYESFTAPDARVLVVDDVRMNLQVVCGLLEHLQMKIDTAESGEEAVALAQKYHYDVILMDHMMPGMDGITAARQIRGLGVKTGDHYYETAPILALTANALSGMREMYLEAGMQDFISKPVRGRDLEAVLKKWLPADKIVPGGRQENENVTCQAEDAGNESVTGDWEVSIDGLNVEEAKAYFTQKEMYIDALGTFLAAIPATAEKIDTYGKTGAVQDYIVIVHGLKSSSRIIGAEQLSELARQSEQLAKSGAFVEAVEKTPQLLQLLSDVQSAIRGYLGNEPARPKQTLTKEELTESLLRLRDCARDFDMGGLLAWEKATADDGIPEEYQEVWNQVKEAVTNVAFSRLSEILDAFFEQD